MDFINPEDASVESIETAQAFFERYDGQSDVEELAENLDIKPARAYRWLYSVKPNVDQWPFYDDVEEASRRLQRKHGFDLEPRDSTSEESSQQRKFVKTTGQDIAQKTDTACSSISEAVSKDRSCKEYPVHKWAVQKNGRTQYYLVPKDKADRIGLKGETITKSDIERSDDDDFNARPDLENIEPEMTEEPGTAEDQEADPEKLEEEYEQEANDPFDVDDKYSYIEHQDVYLLDIPSYSSLYVWPGAKARELAELYSDFDDDPWTLDMCGRHFGFPVHVMSEIKRALRLRHKSPPRLREEFKEGDVDEFVQDDLAKLEHSYQKKLEKKQHGKIKRDAKKWHERAAEIDKRSERQAEKLAEMNAHYEVDPLELPFQEEGLPKGALFCNWQDLHIGKRRYQGDSSLQTYKEDLLSGADALFARAAMTAELEKVYLLVGGDLCHADTYYGETTRGTPQDCVANPTDLESSCEDFMVEAVDKARQALKAHNPEAKVELVPVFGNHDRKTSFSIYRFLYAWYRNVDDVNTPLDADERVYREYRNWFLACTHGDVSKKRMRKMPQIMMQEAEGINASTKQMVLYHGHLHTEQVKVDAGVKRHRAPSPSNHDRYDNRNAYVANPKVLPGHLLYGNAPDDQFMNAGILNKE